MAPETCYRPGSALVKPDFLVPVQEAVVVNGTLVWRIYAGEHCVEASSGEGAWNKLRHLCLAKGITLATTGVTVPTVGPPLLPDPGV
jgi:hypothetical protein